jgi:hypothetical protein
VASRAGNTALERREIHKSILVEKPDEKKTVARLTRKLVVSLISRLEGRTVLQ